MGGPIDLDPVDRLVWRFDHFHVSTILHRTPRQVISSKFMALFMQLGTAVNQSKCMELAALLPLVPFAGLLYLGF